MEILKRVGHDFFVDSLSETQREQGRIAISKTTEFLETYLKSPLHPPDQQTI